MTIIEATFEKKRLMLVAKEEKDDSVSVGSIFYIPGFKFNNTFFDHITFDLINISVDTSKAYTCYFREKTTLFKKALNMHFNIVDLIGKEMELYTPVDFTDEFDEMDRIFYTEAHLP